MAGIRSVLLHLDATRASAARLAFAHALADRHGARVTALFGVGPDRSQSPFAYSASAALQAAEAHESPLGDERARLRELSADGERESVWCDVVGDSLVHGFLAEALYADLLVLGAPGGAEEGGPPAGFVEAVILQGGAPVVLVPAEGAGATICERALIAWNGSIPAARAARAALPLLRLAAQVDVVSWARQTPGAPFSGLDLGDWLRRHDVDARLHRRPAVGRVAEELRALVRQLGSDLVVMGCYGHSRVREQVFGGVTRRFLAALPVPVLMAH
jgi:nucleotide-binding universal stress UspA family protein